MRRCSNYSGILAKRVSYAESSHGTGVCDKVRQQLEETRKAMDVRGRQRCSSEHLFRLLEACIADRDLDVGRRVHELIVRNGYERNTFLGHHIIRMYASHGCLVEASNVFSKLPAPNVFVWASIISAHSNHGQAKRAIELYEQIGNSPVKPDSYVYVAALKACSVAADIAAGKRVHADVTGMGLETNVFVGNSLIDMYAKCESLDKAREVFDRMVVKDVVTWNTMIAGYAQNGHAHEAIELYGSMQLESVTPDVVTAVNILKALTQHGQVEEAIKLYRELRGSRLKLNDHVFVAVLKACASSGDLASGHLIHGDVRECGFESNFFVGSALVDMYVKCGSLKKARSVFDSLPKKNVVTWSAMIAGYAQDGLGQEALILFESMQHENVRPDEVTWVSLLQACGSIGAIQEGRRIHNLCVQAGVANNVIVGSVLIDMYARCGSLKDARLVFDNLTNRNVVTWTTFINGFAQNNDCRMAIQCFEKMLTEGVEPNAATFTALLVACCHVGWVSEGQQYFKMMSVVYGIVPTVEHHTCLVDLLGRSGRLDEAENVLQTMAMQGDDVGWISLLSACKSYGDVERATRCFDRIVKLDPQQAAAYALMSQICMAAGRWEDANSVERLRRCAGAHKLPAKATIEINKKVLEFVVGARRDDLSTKLRSLNQRLKEGGHVPKTGVLLKHMSHEEKEDALCGHAEKLALAFGLLNTPNGTPLLITKNLRMCTDCHSGTKILSRIEDREVIVRDAHRIHHFKNGLCSCGDYA